MTTYLPRSAWTPSAASGDTLNGILLRGVAVHWPGTSQDRIGDPGQAAIAERLRHYRSFHLGRGWQDIGYNLAIDQAGRVWMLRSTLYHGNLVGAHCASSDNPDANREYVGVLLLLGDQEPLSDAMIEAFRDWYHDIFLPRWPNRHDVRGHGQVAGAATSCPGPFARAVMGDLTVPNPDPEPHPVPSMEAHGMILVRQDMGEAIDRIWLLTGTHKRYVATVSAYHVLREHIPYQADPPISSELLQSFVSADPITDVAVEL